MSVLKQELKEAAKFLAEYPHPKDPLAYFFKEKPTSYTYLKQIQIGDRIIGYGTVQGLYNVSVGLNLVRYITTDTGYTSLTFPEDQKIPLY